MFLRKNSEGCGHPAYKGYGGGDNDNGVATDSTMIATLTHSR